MTRVPFTNLNLAHRVPMTLLLLGLSQQDYEKQTTYHRDDLRFARLRYENAKAKRCTHDAPTVRMARVA